MGSVRIGVAVALALSASVALANGAGRDAARPGGTTAAQPGTSGTMAPGTAGGTAGGQTGAMGGQAGAMQMGAERMPFEATKHVGTVNVGLSAAANGAQMLQKLSQEAMTYDQVHGKELLEYCRNGIADAREHLAHLQSMVTKPDHVEKVNTLSQRVDRAQQLVGTLSGELQDPQAVNADARKLHDELRGALGPLRDVAAAMDIKLELQPIG